MNSETELKEAIGSHYALCACSLHLCMQSAPLQTFLCLQAFKIFLLGIYMVQWSSFLMPK